MFLLQFTQESGVLFGATSLGYRTRSGEWRLRSPPYDIDICPTAMAVVDIPKTRMLEAIVVHLFLGWKDPT